MIRFVSQVLPQLLLLDPAKVARALQDAQAAGLVGRAPSLWQISLGVMRMVHRTLTRPESIGLSLDRTPRQGLAARLLQWRPLRAPLVLGIGAVRPWDLSGLLSQPHQLIRHLVGTHHDRHQFAYDLQILSLTPGALDALYAAAQHATGDSWRARLYQDLCVFDGYHDALLHAADAARSGDFLLSTAEAGDPDISFAAYLAWCAAQPVDAAATLAAWRAGEFQIGASFGVATDRLSAAAVA